MRYLIPATLVVALALSSVASAADFVFEGPWNTTNRKLDGSMTCVVKDLGDEKWQGRFHGVWQGVPFDYTVAFQGPLDKLEGRSTIDGASYTWSGAISADAPRSFHATFTGNRYTGYFKLKEKTKSVAVSR